MSDYQVYQPLKSADEDYAIPLAAPVKGPLVASAQSYNENTSAYPSKNTGYFYVENGGAEHALHPDEVNGGFVHHANGAYGTVLYPDDPRQSKVERFMSLASIRKSLFSITWLIYLSALNIATIIFSVLAFAFVFASGVLGVGLLPLACLGLLVLGSMRYLIRPIAALDEYLFDLRSRLYHKIAN